MNYFGANYFRANYFRAIVLLMLIITPPPTFGGDMFQTGYSRQTHLGKHNIFESERDGRIEREEDEILLIIKVMALCL
jgi:hypothetical protein